MSLTKDQLNLLHYSLMSYEASKKLSVHDLEVVNEVLGHILEQDKTGKVCLVSGASNSIESINFDNIANHKDDLILKKDQSLLGGVMVRKGDKLMNGTVRHSLDVLKKKLKK